MAGLMTARWHRWVDRNPWLPWLHGSDGRSGKQRARAEAVFWGVLHERATRQHRGDQHG